MSDILIPIGACFDRSTDAVILSGNQLIQYLNPAAQALFPHLTAGEPLPVPLDTLPPDSTASLSAEGKVYTCRTQSLGDRTLYTLSPVPEEAILPNHRLPQLTQKLRGPLSSLINVEAALSRLPTYRDSEKAELLLSRMEKAELRLMRMIHTLELASLPQSKEPYDFSPAVVDLNGLCHEAFRQLEFPLQSVGITLKLKLSTSNLYTLLDDNLFLILIYHLVSNSVRASEPGSTITISVERRRSRALVFVDDEGIGLTDDQLAILFDPARGNERLSEMSCGLGLGIPVCRRIALLHKSVLVFSNRVEGGVRAALSIPLSDEPFREVLRSPSLDTTNGFPLVLRELSDVLPASCFHSDYR